MQVVLAEDNRELRTLLAELLREDGHAVIEVRDGDELASLIATDAGRWRDPVVISDMGMPGQSGLSVLRTSRRLAWCPRFILISGFADDETYAEAEQLGALAVFDKVAGLQKLRQMVATLARRSS